MKAMSPTAKPILDDLKARLHEIYGERLKGIILFGSYARGDCTEGSDIDVIMLLGGRVDPIEERKSYFDAIWELDMKYDTLISVVPLSEEDYRLRRSPLILNARKEGLLL